VVPRAVTQPLIASPAVAPPAVAPPAVAPPVAAPGAIPPTARSPQEAPDSFGRWAKKTVEVPHEAMATLIDETAPSTPALHQYGEHWSKKTVEVPHETMAPLIDESAPSDPTGHEANAQWAKQTLQYPDEQMAPLVDQTRGAPMEGAPPSAGPGEASFQAGAQPGAPGVSGPPRAADTLVWPEPPSDAHLAPPPAADARVSRWLLPVMAISFGGVFALGIGIYLLRKPASDPAAGAEKAAATATVSADSTHAAEGADTGDPAKRAAPPTPAAATATAAAAAQQAAAPAATAASPAAPAPAAPEGPGAAGAASGAEAEAREALSRLREGVVACTRDTLGVLPGTSPAVPPTLAFLKSGAYPSSPRDWAAPVWYCTKFRQSGAQRFQIQWQMTKPSAEGMGVAWLDENADGKADRALGFRATLKEKGKAEVTEVEVIDAAHPVTPAPR
jgi:hypothetical protein